MSDKRRVEKETVTDKQRVEKETVNDKRRPDNTTDKLLQARTTDQIIEVMREEDEAAARKEILSQMTPACREKFQYIEHSLRQEVSHGLRRRYELGLQVQELYEDEKKGGKLYGKDAIGRICEVLKWDDGLIRLALRFVQVYTPEDLERLCAKVLPKGEPLTWSHLRALLPLEDAKRRQELLDRTVADGWSCNQLAYEIKRLADGSPKDGRGRPPAVPKDFDGALAKQQQSAEQWDRLHTRVWSKDDRSLVAQAAKLPPEEVTEVRLRQARELASQLRRVAEQVLAQAEKAEEVVRKFERILNERRQAEPARKTA
jgi:hypothetical protein